MRLFVFGFGYSARAIVERVRPQLGAIWGTTRDPGKLADIAALGVIPILFDGSGAPASPGTGEAESARSAELGEGPEGGRGRRDPHPVANATRPLPFRERRETPAQSLAEADHILVSIPPAESGDPVLRHFRNELASLTPKAVVYLSTVGVYGDHDGAWVDEETPCRPVSKRSRQRVEAEAAWRQFAEETGIPLAIIRLAGIYGPDRGPFEKIRRGTARRVVKPGQVFNRIHVDDIAAIVEAAFLRRADGVFNGSDNEPAPPDEVLAYAAGLLGLPPPPEVPFDSAVLSPMARSFYGENKRVRNEKIKNELGVRLRYPTYREGLCQVARSSPEAGTRLR